MECLTTPQVSVFPAGKPPGHAPQATKHPLLFCCPSSALKVWFQALRLHFFFPSQTIFFAMLLKMDTDITPIFLPLTGKDTPEGLYDKKCILSSAEQDHPVPPFLTPRHKSHLEA